MIKDPGITSWYKEKSSPPNDFGFGSTLKPYFKATSLAKSDKGSSLTVAGNSTNHSKSTFALNVEAIPLAISYRRDFAICLSSLV